MNGKYVVTVLRHEEGSTWVAIPGTVLSGKEAQGLEVSNLGRQLLTWRVSHVFARAKQSEFRNIAQVGQSSIDEGELDFFQVDGGYINPGEMAQLADLLKRIEVCFSRSKTYLGITYPWGDADLSDFSTVLHYSNGKSRAISGGCKSKIILSKVFSGYHSTTRIELN